VAGHEAAADHADALQRPQRADGKHNQRQQIFGQSHCRISLSKSIDCAAMAAMKEPKEGTRSRSLLLGDLCSILSNKSRRSARRSSSIDHRAPENP
jgi:hypothetical protein